MVLRLTLDVNVWVSHYLSLSRGRDDSVGRRLVHSAFDGWCRLGPIQPIISHGMLNTLRDVLVRLGLTEVYAEAARDAVDACATNGVIGVPPHLVLAGGIQAIRDAEDREVLETAIAGRADLLVTNNIRDFAPGPRAEVDAEIVRVGGAGNPDIIILRHAKLPHGLVIANPAAAHAWLLGANKPPSGVLERFVHPNIP